MTTVSRMVANRAGHSRYIDNAITVHGPECGEALDKKLEAIVGPLPFRTYDFLMYLNKYLKNCMQVMYKADENLGLEIDDDSKYRDNRDHNVDSVRNLMIKLKTIIEMTYGEDVAVEYGLIGETVSSIELLIKQAFKTATHLETNPDLGPTLDNLPAIDAAALGRTLRALAEAAKVSLDTVNREEREYQKALRDRDIAVEDWKKGYVNIGRITSAIYSLAGYDKLADRVRPSYRKASGEEKVQEGEDQAATAPQTQIGSQTTTTPADNQ
ncbi:MAG: hypothetical protein ACLFSB_11190 [Chitinispirillaceae bacterium]